MRSPRRNRPRARKGPLPFRYVLLLSFLIFVVLTVQGLWIIEKGIRPTLVHIATTETRKIATLAINDAVSKKISSSLNQEELFITDYTSDGMIRSVQFNSQIYTRVLSEATARVQRYLRLVEQGQQFDITIPDEVELDEGEAQGMQDIDAEGGIIHTIPLGQATNNALLAHLGPQIPVRFSAIGDVKTDMSYKVVDSGINNTTLSYHIDVEVDVKIVIPFATDTDTVSTQIVIGSIFVPGEVPEYYSQGGGGMILPAGVDKTAEAENEARAPEPGSEPEPPTEPSGTN
ncbi:sporulation protein YunB [Alkalihalobacillus sp. MEB130]|uniref:sporulation protein YunB n=1 Tax=Alkalihalobacillus sp. MEB130 TaxID=2976704 RepID=UPI0028DF6B52|nr:sporulation protein YunB [Alkalihalobacillus sp. MEB130]MDT8858662.1 sporulation protein YunB [Alkalihalobacillus sp. MEB130]